MLQTEFQLFRVDITFSSSSFLRIFHRYTEYYYVLSPFTRLSIQFKKIVTMFDGSYLFLFFCIYARNLIYPSLLSPYNVIPSSTHHSSRSAFHLPHVICLFFIVNLFLWLMNATMRRDDGSYDTARHPIVKRIWFECVRAPGDDHEV